MTTASSLPLPAPPAATVARLAPGIGLCAGIATVALGLQAVEAQLTGRAWLEAVVLAILLGTAVRTAWLPGERWRAGIAFSAKPLLELGIVLLGATLSAASIAAAGPALLAGIVAIVVVAIGAGYGIGRLLGLPPRMATLIACGNAICGNSAIAAVAPVIGADGRDVAASIAFTAVLGIAVVLGLPLLAAGMSLSDGGVGMLAGLTVYAVPQVLAATAPAGAVAMQVGTLVKLIRVLMLGPVILVLSVIVARNVQPGAPASAGSRPRRAVQSLGRLVPWFILGFLALATARSVGVIPPAAASLAGTLAGWLTIVAMAALGLGVDLRAVARAGLRASAAVTLSLAVLACMALLLIQALGPA